VYHAVAINRAASRSWSGETVIQTGAAAPASAGPQPSGLRLVRRLWPLVAATAMAPLPGTALGLFMVPIAAELASSVATVGGLRSLGGLAALATALLAAPLIDRLPRAWSVAGSLALLGAAVSLAAFGHLAALLLFYLLLGGASAVLWPAVQAASSDHAPGPSGARAAALVLSGSAAGTALAGPLLALPASAWGWRGAVLAVAVVAFGLSLVALRTLSHRPPDGVARHSYLATFPQVLAAPRAAVLLLASTCYASTFFGWITYLAASLTERFGLETPAIAALWAVNGAMFCAGSLLAGRRGAPEAADPSVAARPDVAGGRLLLAGLLLAALAGPACYLASSPAVALLLAPLYSLGDGMTVAGIVRLLLARYPDLRGAVLGLNGAANHFGIFFGTGVGGLALGLAAYTGLAGFLGGLSLLALATMLWALRPAGRGGGSAD